MANNETTTEGNLSEELIENSSDTETFRASERIRTLAQLSALRKLKAGKGTFEFQELKELETLQGENLALVSRDSSGTWALTDIGDFALKAYENEEPLQDIQPNELKKLWNGEASYSLLNKGLIKISPSVNVGASSVSIGVFSPIEKTVPIQIEEKDSAGHKTIKPGYKTTPGGEVFLLDDKGEFVFPFPLSEKEELTAAGYMLEGKVWTENAPQYRLLKPAYEALSGKPKPALIGKLKGQIKRFVFLPEEARYTLSASWALGTFFYQLFAAYPYLHINGNKGSGKSRHASTLEKLSFRGLSGVNMSVSALFRLLDSTRGTLIIDEEEALGSGKVKTNDERGQSFISILNSGYSKDSPAVHRSEAGEGKKKNTYETVSFRVSGPKVIVNIEGISSETLRDRTIRLNMIRTGGLRLENISKPEVRAQLEKLNYECLASFLLYWREVKTNYETLEEELKERETGRLGHLNDRLAELWLPLLAVSKTFGTEAEFSDILALSKSYAETKTEDESEDSNLSLVLGAAFLALRETGNKEAKVSLAEITDKALSLQEERSGTPREQIEWIKPRWLGRELGKLDLYGPTQRGFFLNHKAGVFLKETELRDRANRYSVTLPGEEGRRDFLKIFRDCLKGGETVRLADFETALKSGGYEMPGELIGKAVLEGRLETPRAGELRERRP